MTSVRSLLHDSGGWFDTHTEQLTRYIVNNNSAVGTMPFTTPGEDDSTYIDGYRDNATEEDANIKTSKTSEADVEIAVSDDSCDNEICVCREDQGTSVCEACQHLVDVAEEEERCNKEELQDVNCNTCYCDQTFSAVRQSLRQESYSPRNPNNCNNINEHKEITNPCQFRTEGHLARDTEQLLNVPQRQQLATVKIVIDSFCDSDGREGGTLTDTSSDDSKNELYHSASSSSDSYNDFPMSDVQYTENLQNKNRFDEHTVLEDNQTLPNSPFINEALDADLTDALDRPVFQVGSCDDSDEECSIEEPLWSRSVSPSSDCELMDMADNVRYDIRKVSCCSITSLSSLCVADFLLRPQSASPSPDVSSEKNTPKDETDPGDVNLLRRLSYIPRRPSFGSCETSRRSSLISLSRPASPIFGERSLSPITASSASSQASYMTADSDPASCHLKPYLDERRISELSEISSISLGLLGDRESMLTPDITDERNERHSASPFGDQLKYFQNKRKNEMFLVKATTARLGLNTRRNSYSQWREENLDFKGKPIVIKPEISVGKKTDVFTKERVTAINLAMDWIRDELRQLKDQDESLAHQLLEIRRTIHELKLDWSCESHREMLMDAEDELKESKNLKRVSDLPEHHTVDWLLRDKGVTRRLGHRKYSIF